MFVENLMPKLSSQLNRTKSGGNKNKHNYVTLGKTHRCRGMALPQTGYLGLIREPAAA